MNPPDTWVISLRDIYPILAFYNTPIERVRKKFSLISTFYKGLGGFILVVKLLHVYLSD